MIILERKNKGKRNKKKRVEMIEIFSFETDYYSFTQSS